MAAMLSLFLHLCIITSMCFIIKAFTNLFLSNYYCIVILPQHVAQGIMVLFTQRLSVTPQTTRERYEVAYIKKSKKGLSSGVT